MLSNAPELVNFWISQYKIGYFPPKDIVHNISEECGEIAGALLEKKEEKISEELGDLLIRIIFLANSKKMNLDSLQQKVPENIYKINETSTMYNLTKYVGEINREINHLHGSKKKKESEQTEGLLYAMNNVVQYTKQLAKLHSIDINKSFTQRCKRNIKQQPNIRINTSTLLFIRNETVIKNNSKRCRTTRTTKISRLYVCIRRRILQHITRRF